MSEPGPYTTITVTEFNRLATTIQNLRWRIQRARELLERGDSPTALQVLAVDSDGAE